MRIETKYSIGDTVYTIYNNAIMECEITGVKVEVDSGCENTEKYKIVSKNVGPYSVNKNVTELFGTIDNLIRLSLI